MKLGMNMLLWSSDVSGPDYQSVFEMLRDAGFDGVEVPIFDTSPEAFAGYEQIGRRLSDLGLEVLGVGARSGDDSPISPDPAVRERGLRADQRRRRHLRRPRRQVDLRPARRTARVLHRRRSDVRGAAARSREPASGSRARSRRET